MQLSITIKKIIRQENFNNQAGKRWHPKDAKKPAQNKIFKDVLDSKQSKYLLFALECGFMLYDEWKNIIKLSNIFSLTQSPWS